VTNSHSHATRSDDVVNRVLPLTLTLVLRKGHLCLSDVTTYDQNSNAMSFVLCCHLNGISAFMINNLQLARPTHRPWGSTAPYILPLNSLHFAPAARCRDWSGTLRLVKLRLQCQSRRLETIVCFPPLIGQS
jgi:hypothetical protein